MSRPDVIEEREIERDGKRFKVEITYDDWGDISHLGEFTDKKPDHGYYFNRETGTFHGEPIEWKRRRALGLPVPDFDYETQETIEGVLRENLGCTCDRNSFEYFVPEYIHPDALDEDMIKACVEDWERAEAYCKGEWSVVVVTVQLIDDDDEEIDSEILGGVESDCDDYIDEVIGEQIATLLERVKERSCEPVMELVV